MELHSITTCEWQKLPDNCTIEPNTVDICLFPLHCDDIHIEVLKEFLSIDESERAGRFVTQKLQREYISCRFMLRSILARYLKRTPSEIDFYYNGYGKPFLSMTHGESLFFNLSHSDSIGLLAVTTDVKVGIDLEKYNQQVSWTDIANREFTEREQRILMSAPHDERINLFYMFWTRKEAVLKGIGKGLTVPLNCVDVSEAPPKPVLFDQGSETVCEKWSISDIKSIYGFAAAAAYSATYKKLSYFRVSIHELLKNEK